MRSSEMIIIALATAALATGGVLAVVFTPPPSPCSGITGATRTFTVIADSNGYNGSKLQAGSWPIVNVQRCDTVVFNVINKDTQAHSFAVAYYSNAGLELVGGNQQTLRFQATRTGQYRIYCTNPCSIHPYMQNGLLNVT